MTAHTPEQLVCPECGRRVGHDEWRRRSDDYRCRCGSTREPIVDFGDAPMGDHNVPDDEDDELDASTHDAREEAVEVLEDEGAPGTINPQTLPR